MEVLEERGMMPFLRELHRGSPFSGSRPGASCSRANGLSGTIPTTTRLRALFPAWDSRRFSAIRTPRTRDGGASRAAPDLSRGNERIRHPGLGPASASIPAAELEALGTPVSCFAKVDRMVKRRPDLVPGES